MAGTRITQLVPAGVSGRRYGAFAGKTASGGSAHPVVHITTLWPYGGPGRLYSSFADKGGAVASGGLTYRWTRKRRR